MSTPLVSIVTTVYDRTAFLAQAVDSVRRQSVSDWEHIIVEDAGPVDARRVLGGASDPRIRFLRAERNLGVSGARNLGIGAAAGQYVAFLDDDDLLESEALALRLEAIRKRNVRLLFTQWRTLGGGGERLHGPGRDFPLRDLLFVNPFSPGAVLIERSFLGADPFPVELRANEDWALWIRFAAEYGALPVLPVPTSRLRAHEFGRLTDDRNEMARWRLAMYDWVLARYGDRFAASDRQTVAFSRMAALARTGDLGAAWQAAGEMFALGPASAPALFGRKLLHTVRSRIFPT